MPRRRTPPSCMRRVTAPLPAARATSPHHSLLHAPCRCTPPCCTHLPHRRAPPSRTCHVATPLLAAHAMSPHPSQLRPSLPHTPRHHAPPCCMHHITAP